MMQHINIWENLYKDHEKKQLQNPFSEWACGHPQLPLTSPTGEYAKPPTTYISRSPSPFREPLPNSILPKLDLFTPQSPRPFSQKIFNPLDQCPKPDYSQTFNQPEEEPSRSLNQVSAATSQAYNQNVGKAEEKFNFLSQVRKWRNPEAEFEELTPLTKIPEPAKPPEPIKVTIPIPGPWEDPVRASPQNFSPHSGLDWAGGSAQKLCNSPRVEKSEFGNWGTLPEEEYSKFTPASPVKENEAPEFLPGWKPMSKTFANIIRGGKTIGGNSSNGRKPQGAEFGNKNLNPVRSWDQSVDIPQYFSNQPQETESSDMNYRRQDMSSQINQWQQRAIEHEQKQLLNPFSEWEGASHRAKLSKTDPNYGKPIEGSMTEIRGKMAGDHISNEILELCSIITDFGERQRDNSVIIKFGTLFQVYTRISNKLVGMLMRARKQDLVHFEGEMLYQGRDDDVVIKLLKAVEQQTPESAVGIKSESGNEARGFGMMPAQINKSAAAITSGYSAGEMMSKSESANSASMLMKKDSSICSSSMMNEESNMSMMEESLGSTKMMASSSNSSQVMSKEDGEFNTKMFAGSSNTSKMMSKEESSNSKKMFSESSSSMKTLKEEGSLSTQMLGEAVGDSSKMLAGLSLSPSVTQDALLDSLKSATKFNTMKMVPGGGSNSQQMMPCNFGNGSSMASSEMLSTQQASSSSSSSMMSSSSSSKQMSTASEQMSTAMENVSMSGAESNQMKMSSAQMSSATEQMSMASEQMSTSNRQMSSATEQMSMASEQMSTSNRQMSSATEQMSSATEQMSMASKHLSNSSQVKQMSTSEMMSNLLDNSFGKIASAQDMTTSDSVQSMSQQSSSSKSLSKAFSSFESSDTALMDETHSVLSSEIQDLKQLN